MDHGLARVARSHEPLADTAELKDVVVTARAIADQKRPSLCPVPPTNGTLRALIRSPSRPSTAEGSVSAARTETRATRIAPTPRLRRIVSGMSSIPDMAKRAQREGDDDREDGKRERDQGRDERPEDEHQDHERSRPAEVELARLQVLVEDQVHVPVGGPLACDGDVERASIGRLDDLDHLLDPALGIAAEADRDQRGAAVARDE